jgi:hypothetical protein
MRPCHVAWHQARRLPTHLRDEQERRCWQAGSAPLISKVVILADPEGNRFRAAGGDVSRAG